jgi:hypothetical protein
MHRLYSDCIPIPIMDVIIVVCCRINAKSKVKIIDSNLERMTRISRILDNLWRSR